MPNYPEGNILNVLKGKIKGPLEVLDPLKTGSRVKVHLVEKGSGMVGLENREDNKDWAGIFNHVLRTARLATFLANRLNATGCEVNPQIVLNTILVSHSGRRQFDEASWYPDAVDRANEKVKIGDNEISLRLLAEADVSPTIIENVKAHGVGISYPISQVDTWEKQITLYADFRTSQGIISLRDRFNDLQARAVPSGRISQESLDQLGQWASEVEEKIFSKLDGIKPEDINNDNPSEPRWESYVRGLYVQDAEHNIFNRLSEIENEIENCTDSEKKARLELIINKEFPLNTWWGKYVRELYKKQAGKPYKSSITNKKYGIDRAIAFFSQLDQKRLKI